VTKGAKCYFEVNNILIFSFILIIAISFINNSFSENQSKPNLNDFKLNQFFNSTQTYTNSKLEGNFFLLKDNDIYIPINFYSNNKNIFNNAIYEKDKNHLTLILNHPVYNNNSLILQIPRNILDSKTKDDKDDKFTVLLNNKPSKYVEINNKSLSAINLNSIEDIQAIRNILNDTANRIISIKFDKDSKVIKISGTDQSENQSKIPKITNKINNEFSFINSIITIIIILTIAIITMFFLYKNGKLRFIKTFKFKRKLKG
jgi:hypothetical protein